MNPEKRPFETARKYMKEYSSRFILPAIAFLGITGGYLFHDNGGGVRFIEKTTNSGSMIAFDFPAGCGDAHLKLRHAFYFSLEQDRFFEKITDLPEYVDPLKEC